MIDYSKYKRVIAADGTVSVGLRTDGTVCCAGDGLDEAAVDRLYDIVAVETDGDVVFGLKADGSVVIAENEYYEAEYDVSNWHDIVDIVCGGRHLIGLKSDGTVMATGADEHGECDVSDWRDIVSISAWRDVSVGVKADGTVVVAGELPKSCDISDWHDIVEVAVAHSGVGGLKRDGTVVWQCREGYEKDTSDWHDMAVVFVCFGSIAGIKTDGTLVAELDLTPTYGDHYFYESEWHDIVFVAEKDDHTLAVRADGTAAAAGENYSYQCEVYDWKDIGPYSKEKADARREYDEKRNAEIDARKAHLLAKLTEFDKKFGVSSQGYIHTVGYPGDGKPIRISDADDPRDEPARTVKLGPQTLEEYNAEIERIALRKRRSEEEEREERDKIEAIWRKKEEEKERFEQWSKGICIYCGGEVRGIFRPKCKSCGKPRASFFDL